MTSELPENLFSTIPPEETEETSNVNLREELLLLSKKGEIKQSEKFIQKASQETLEKIKKDYDIKQLDATNDYISEKLISNFSEIMEQLNFVGDSKEMEEELEKSSIFKKEIKSLIGNVTPFIPFIGLFCGGVIIAKHILNKRYNDGMQTEQTEDTG